MSNEAMKMALAKQLTIALQNLGAPVELLCIVGVTGIPRLTLTLLKCSNNTTIAEPAWM
ncbi:hypothetical protein [Klebsiella michiganensis]|uniref:hypothetical protein n=1 Tax=Klebsiella michiganensis TaxID=1134687 RepID=UPI001D181EE6|nr:hypothetical protein [Klebsiella michiganensis]